MSLNHRIIECAWVVAAALGAVACGSDEATPTEPGCEDPTISSEEDLEDFVWLGCTKVNSLSIRYHESPSLAGLEKLTSVTDRFILISSSVTSLTGLEGLTNVGKMFIGPAPNLASVGSLEALTRAGELHIVNTGLTDLSGLARIEDVRVLEIRQNAKLSSLTPLDTWPEGTVSDSVAASDNPLLAQCGVDAFVATQAPSEESCACTGNGAGACD